jgi:hypothetical protein
MGLLTGDPLPSVSVNQGSVTTAPKFYTDYLGDLAKRGAEATAGAKFVGPTALQNQAFDLTGKSTGLYKPGMDMSMNLLQQGTQTAPSVVGQYMNPYINDVVNQIGTLGQRNITQNLAPGATSGAVGMGQFGSKRGAEVLGNTLRDALQDIGVRQTGALSAGYKDAMTAAQTDLSRQLMGGQLAGTLAGDVQKYNLADINALSTMGAQQQQIGQAQQDYTLGNLKKESDLLRGYTVPTSVASTYQGPLPGAYGPSTLSTLSGVAALLNAQLPGSTSGSGGSTIGSSIVDALSKILGKSSGSNISGTSGTGAGVPGAGTGTYTDTSGVTYDNMGNPVSNQGSAQAYSDWWNTYGKGYNWDTSTGSDYTGAGSSGGITI